VTAALLLVIALAAALVGGFLAFLSVIDAAERHPDGRAEAIVAFSGDPQRIWKAVELLANGRGRRLFVTGADNADEVARQEAAHRDLFACCVDVNHAARDTHADAAAIRRWVEEHAFRSIVVVTSSLHLPRALLELDATLPGVHKVPSAVVTGLVDWRGWRRDPRLWKLLGREYLKCIGALLRNQWAQLRPLGRESAT
jgi:uncharacterized SAM-binding protein YcdF (DUF218 family)